MNSNEDKFLINTLKQFQKYIQQSIPAASASYTLLGSILFLTGLGYFFDTYFDSSPIGISIGLAIGLLVGFYELYKTIFLK